MRIQQPANWPQLAILHKRNSIRQFLLRLPRTLTYSEPPAGVLLVEDVTVTGCGPIKGGIGARRSRRGHNGFLSLEGMRRVPHRAIAGGGVVDGQANKTAVELLMWLDTVTSRSATKSIRGLLDEHEKDSSHMRDVVDVIAASPTRPSLCEHISKIATLVGATRSGENRTGLLLTPTRGYNVSEAIADEGVNDLIFPRFWVLS